MPHVLHLIKDPTSRLAFEVIANQAADPAIRLSVVLLQNATQTDEPLPGDVYRLNEGQGPADSVHPAITHADLLDLIFAADSVVSW